ncbi:hypothetical protein EYR41_000663 [Orbilia oligospora]|uniref:Uncharacterized protein n=1 Tax=Orbilia oligospora TaxID=2813651 RepID=A0A8H2HP84_ORBOL|nr:hypothetical protein EYR41_000663 [Orbilia oligospora]
MNADITSAKNSQPTCHAMFRYVLRSTVGTKFTQVCARNTDTAPSSGATGQIRLNGRFALEHGVKEAMEDFPRSEKEGEVEINVLEKVSKTEWLPAWSSLVFEFEGYSPGCFGRSYE